MGSDVARHSPGSSTVTAGDSPAPRMATGAVSGSYQLGTDRRTMTGHVGPIQATLAFPLFILSQWGAPMTRRKGQSGINKGR